MLSSNSPIPDEVLLHRMAGRDATALAELQQRYSSTLYALVFGIIMDADRAERLVSEVFDQVWLAADLLTTRNRRASAWLRQMAKARARAYRAGAEATKGSQ
jgi:RNA polymerase sigma-70 factor, ECF subfamily